MIIRRIPIFLRTFNAHILPKRFTGLECGIIPGKQCPDVEVKFENYLNRPDIDSWELRKALCELHGLDMVPGPQIIIASLKACRRLNDYALAIRMLEAVKFKCGHHHKTIWPYICQEIYPTLKELGVELPEKLGYDKPELWKKDDHHCW
ncbi:unnamed protein product [Nezara viridula]|uniref:Cytochrome c oxidase subunit 5A, mitochondrial n=1 Tax=Nezara viridula TaxID=85310 RepID=A0A9P0HAK0_NEZVI|nr:unnamed protein product [Nezara viridula]